MPEEHRRRKMRSPGGRPVWVDVKTERPERVLTSTLPTFIGYPALMRISDERARELAEIHEEDFGEKLSVEEARTMGSGLVALYLKLMEPLPSERDEAQQEDS